MKKKLSIIPVPDARLIPRYLLEQVKDRRWEVDEWYKYQMELREHKENVLLSVIDKSHTIKGVIWLTVDGFEKLVYINLLSMDREYQRKGQLIKFVTKYIRDLAKALKIDTVLWVSDRARAYERYGFELSKRKLIEVKV